MGYIIYPICTFCKFPFKLTNIFIDPCSVLKIQYLCKCPHVKKHTLNFDEYYYQLNLNNNLHTKLDYDNNLSSGYCETCHYAVCEFCEDYHFDHILLRNKIKKIIPKCQLHRDKLTNYCETCSKGLCNKYTTIHQGHEIITTNEFYQKVKKKLDIVKCTNFDEYVDTFLGKNVYYKNDAFISSIKTMFALFIDCFNSEIGLVDVNIMTNVMFLLDKKRIDFYPYIIHKPYLNKISKTYGCLPLLEKTRNERDFKNRELIRVEFIKQLINKKIIIQYHLLTTEEDSGLIFQILDNQLFAAEKEFEFPNTIQFFEELREEVVLIGYYSEDYETGLDIIDFTGIPKIIKSYTKPLICKTDKHFCETFDSLNVLDENIFFYLLPNGYMYIDIKNNKIISLAEYGMSPEITLVKKASDGTLAALLAKKQKIEFWDFYKKENKRTVIIPLENIVNHSDCIIYQKKYIITWIRIKYCLYIACWDYSTSNLIYCVEYLHSIFAFQQLSKNEIIIESHKDLTFRKVQIETGQISQVIQSNFIGYLDDTTVYLNKLILIQNENKIYLLT